MKIVRLILWSISLVLVLPANAVDTLDYNRTMARHYLEANEPDKAESFVRDGLAIATTDPELLQLQKMLKAEQKKAADQRRAEERKTELKAQREAAAEKRSQSELDSSMLCLCRKAEAKLRRQLDSEKEVGATAGVVNKRTLYSLGSQLKAIRDYEAHLIKTGLGDKCAREFDMFEQAECLSRAANYSMDQASK